MTKIVRLFDDDTLPIEQNIIGKLADITVRPSLTEQEVIQNAKDADFIICGYEPLTANVLDSLPNLKMVVFRSIGFNSIDLNKANSLHLPVAHLSSYCVEEVATYVVSAILLHNRRIMDFDHSVKNEHKWQYDLFPNMRRLSTQSVGLIGFGNIAKLVANYLKPFGCKIMAYDPFIPQEEFAKNGVLSVELEDIFKQCDYISSHLPLTPDTDKLIDHSLFNLTTKSPVFINSSRGGVVNEQDLVSALNKDQISYAILDVLQDEYPDLDNNPFVKMDNVILTPHIAFYSTDAMQQGTEDAVKNIVNYLNKDFNQIELVNRQYAQFK